MCLADWKTIAPGGDPVNKTAHKPGCWFRDAANIPNPNQLHGVDVQSAFASYQQQ